MIGAVEVAGDRESNFRSINALTEGFMVALWLARGWELATTWQKTLHSRPDVQSETYVLPMENAPRATRQKG
jgi:hypothetical protein